MSTIIYEKKVTASHKICNRPSRQSDTYIYSTDRAQNNSRLVVLTVSLAVLAAVSAAVLIAVLGVAVLAVFLIIVLIHVVVILAIVCHDTNLLFREIIFVADLLFLPFRKIYPSKRNICFHFIDQRRQLVPTVHIQLSINFFCMVVDGVR